jgi:uncharacterized protein with gpF-like domain
VSPTERAFFERVHRKTGTLTPEMTAAILYAYRFLAMSLPEAEMARLIAIGAVETLILAVLSERTLDLAFRRAREQLQRHLQESIRYAARDLPRGGRIGGELAIRFDYLSRHVQTAIRELDDKILPTLKADVRETVRQAIQAGIEAGKNPRTIARGLRDVVGLSPAQELAVRNYRAELEAGRSGAATKRALHDARFKVTDGMTPAKIDKMVAVYRRNMQGFHAETISRTATLDALKKGQRLAWEQAIDEGIVERGRLQKTWITVGDDRVRDEHVAMQGETVPFDARYSNGEDLPGESTYNCRCLSRYTVARAA